MQGTPSSVRLQHHEPFWASKWQGDWRSSDMLVPCSQSCGSGIACRHIHNILWINRFHGKAFCCTQSHVRQGSLVKTPAIKGLREGCLDSGDPGPAPQQLNGSDVPLCQVVSLNQLQQGLLGALKEVACTVS